jgi:hypothetical protein
MLEILKKFNYTVPILKEYNNDSVDVVKSNQCFTLYVNKHQWNNYNFLYHDEAFQVFPHYYLASGHCLCTGLGFGVRENWLLQNPRVTKITVLEKSRDVIEYHKWLNNPLLKKIELIECDANEYVGSCDTLLLDHYEQEKDQEWLDSIRNISKNVNHNCLWVWSVEPYIEDFSYKNKCSLMTSYYKIKEINNLKLPIISEQTLLMFLFMFFSRHSFKK